ncbi:MAG: SDR family NAD(P)-dependent oxidoreductase [Candidatus Competibacteraceae bacterium]
MSSTERNKIAVIGMAGWYPGAQSLRQLWENVLTKRQQFREMVDCRLPLSDYYDPDKNAPDKVYSRKAAYIENFDFDWQSKRIPKSSVDSSDIVHWLALEVALKALQDASYAKDQVKGSNTAVILGNTLTGEWSRSNNLRLRWPFVRRALKRTAAAYHLDSEALDTYLAAAEAAFKSVFPPVDEDTLAGALSNTVAGRICNYLDLYGGGYTVDGACASSLLAIINGARSLLLNEVDMVFAGGIDISLDAFELVGFAKTGALTPDEMAVYDDRASGFIPGEGCGFVILKRLRDAIDAGDQIYAVINGWGVSSDGRGGITAPSVKGQSKAMRTAYRMAGYDASQLDFVEGHGTGTPVGDRTELMAIQAAMAQESRERSVGVTSFKSIVGHTKAAAGVGAFIKTIIALNRRVLPPIAGTEIPRDVFYTHAKALYPLLDGQIKPASSVLRAGVSAMGFGGINSHVTCESYGAPSVNFKPLLDERALLAHPDDTEVFVLSARSVQGLRQQLAQLAGETRHIAKAELVDLAAELAGRLAPEAPVRAAFLAATPSSLQEKIAALSLLAGSGVAEGAFIHDEQNTLWLSNRLPKRRLAFMFPGQGSQQLNMARPLIQRFDWAAQWLQTCGAYVEALDATPFHARLLVDNLAILPDSRVADLRRQLAQTQVAQPAIGLSSLIWYRYLREVGICPVAVGGHSLGELMALYAGGVYDEQTLLRLCSRRGHEMANSQDEQQGKMAALLCSRADAEALLTATPGYVTIANINGLRQIVISGQADAVDAVCEAAGRRGVSTTRLPVSNAFHSKMMESAAQRFGAEFAQLQGRVSGVKVFSCIDGRPLEGEIQVGDHLQRQMLAQVDFVALANALADTAELVIEVGPGRVLSDLFTHIVSPERARALPVEPSAGSSRGLKQILAVVHVAGHEPNWAAVYANRLVRRYIPADQRQFIENPCERPMRIEPPAMAEVLQLTPVVSARQAPASKPRQAPATPEPSSLENQPEPVSVHAPADLEPARSPRDDALMRVVQVAAALTGYDVATLNGEMRLLDDLNMDSIKAAELLAVLTREFQQLEDVDVSSYANATLAAIAQLITARGAAEPPAVVPLPVQTSAPAPIIPLMPSNARHSASPAGAEQDDIERVLLTRVAELTRFDVSTLAASMRLLDDLNMDSIKAAELLALIAREYNLGDQLEPAQYANARIADIAHAIRGKPQPVPATPAVTDKPDVKQPVAALTKRETWVRNFVVAADRADLPTTPEATAWGGRHIWLIRVENDPIAAACGRHFSNAGAQLSETDFETVRQRPAGVDQVMIVVPATDPTVTKETLSRFITRLQQATAVALAPEAGAARPAIAYLQRHSQPLERRDNDPLFSVNAYVSSLALEQPHINAKVINLDPEAAYEPGLLGQAVSQELSAQSPATIVALDRQLQRWTPAYSVQTPNAYAKRAIDWQADDVVLATGGARGITAACCLDFARQTGVTMVLVGSAPLSEPSLDEKAREIQSVLAQYKAEGLRCHYYASDVSDPAAVAGLIQRVQQEVGLITGLIHGAGLNRPAPVSTVSAQAALHECAPKVLGIAHLLACLDAQQLKVVVGFGSIIGVTGMQGNAWYGFANETLANVLARHRRANPHSHVVTIAYSVWDEVGMGARLGSVANLSKQGIGAIPVTEGVQRFLHLASAEAGTDQVIVAGRMGRYSAWNKADTLPPIAVQPQRGRIIYYQAGVEAVTRQRLSLAEDTYLVDHNFKGSYLFPTVFGLETMAQAVQLVTGRPIGESLSITDIALERPITVSQNYDTEIEVYAEVLERESAAASLRVRAGVRCDLSGFKRDHFAATFVLQELGEGPIHTLEASAKPLHGRQYPPLYGNILFQGPSFQRINTLYRLENPAPGKGVCVFRSAYRSSDFLLGDPYFRDTLLQSVQIIIPNDLSLPVAIERLDLYRGRQSQDEERTCVAYLNKREGDYYFATVVVLAANGRILECLEGYRLKILESRDLATAVATRVVA